MKKGIPEGIPEGGRKMNPGELKRDLNRRKWKAVKTLIKSLIKPPLPTGGEGYLNIRGYKVRIWRSK